MTTVADIQNAELEDFFALHDEVKSLAENQDQLQLLVDAANAKAIELNEKFGGRLSFDEIRIGGMVSEEKPKARRLSPGEKAWATYQAIQDLDDKSDFRSRDLKDGIERYAPEGEGQITDSHRSQGLQILKFGNVIAATDPNAKSANVRYKVKSSKKKTQSEIEELAKSYDKAQREK